MSSKRSFYNSSKSRDKTPSYRESSFKAKLSHVRIQKNLKLGTEMNQKPHRKLRPSTAHISS